MSIRIATYNIEWFDNHFHADNSLKLTGKHLPALEAIKEVLTLLNTDLLMVIEAPNTTTTTGVQDTVTKLENFAQWAGLPLTSAIKGFPSSGRQEIAIMYNPDKMTIKHRPGGSYDSKSNPPFDGELYMDTDEDRIKEVHKHYRPPLEAKVELANGEIFYVMGVHTKSKGIFTSMDRVHYERENVRNRLKLYAECAWIRKRVEDWIAADKRFVVMGDMNDGPGMDVYESRYGRSAVETIMGDLFEPENILRNYAGKPKWKSTGWRPSTARFTDKFTETTVNVMIDHILASPNLPVEENPLKIWNPYEQDNLKPYKDILKKASDHYPITLDIDL